MDEISRLSKGENHLIKVHNGIRAYIRQFDFLLFSRRFNNTLYGLREGGE